MPVACQSREVTEPQRDLSAKLTEGEIKTEYFVQFRKNRNNFGFSLPPSKPAVLPPPSSEGGKSAPFFEAVGSLRHRKPPCHSEERSDVGSSCEIFRIRQSLSKFQNNSARLPRPFQGLAMTNRTFLTVSQIRLPFGSLIFIVLLPESIPPRSPHGGRGRSCRSGCSGCPRRS